MLEAWECRRPAGTSQRTAMADAAPAATPASLSRGLERAHEYRGEPPRCARVDVHLDAGYGAWMLVRPGCLRIRIENRHHVDRRRSQLLGTEVARLARRSIRSA
jgi:hypothetical protein